jgi:predicted nucleic acid-binding protein
MSSFVVLLDACAIFPMSLRDTLLRAADAGLYRLVLTEDILEEVRRNLISERRLTEDKAQRLIDIIKMYFPDAFITHHTLLIASMPINKKDRHVLAAAVASNAQVIVTQNLKDFPSELISPFGIEAQSPDEFLVHLFYLAPQAMVKLIKGQASDLQNPPMSALGLLTTLKLHAPTFVELVLSIMSKDI